MTDTLEITITNQAISVQDIPEVSIRIYPNPARDHIFIRIAGGTGIKASVRIYTAGGKLMLERSITEPTGDVYRIQVTGLPAGNYILKFESDGRLYSQTFIKTE